jgi:hypothetical protein
MYTVYNPVTGQIFYTITGVTKDYFKNESYILGEYNDRDHYVDVNTKTAIDKPQMPSENHVWNTDNKSWQLDQTLASSSIRQQRNQLLSLIDRVNPVWYSTLAADQHAELATYRQSLLNVPQQADFPANVVWPTKPTWL